MRYKLIIVVIASLIFGSIIGYAIAPKYQYHVQDIYFDGEGNEIPNEVVQLLVTSQFVKIEPGEQKELDEYFYLNNHNLK
jgi:hypothetical protein